MTKHWDLKLVLMGENIAVQLCCSRGENLDTFAQGSWSERE